MLLCRRRYYRQCFVPILLRRRWQKIGFWVYVIAPQAKKMWVLCQNYCTVCQKKNWSLNLYYGAAGEKMCFVLFIATEMKICFSCLQISFKAQNFRSKAHFQSSSNSQNLPSSFSFYERYFPLVIAQNWWTSLSFQKHTCILRFCLFFEPTSQGKGMYLGNQNHTVILHVLRFRTVGSPRVFIEWQKNGGTYCFCLHNHILQKL